MCVFQCIFNYKVSNFCLKVRSTGNPSPKVHTLIFKVEKATDTCLCDDYGRLFGNCLQEPARCENPAFVLFFQNMLVEIEQKVVALSQLSVHNENLLLEGKAHTKDEAEQLAAKLRLLKGSLLELQRALHDRQLSMQVSVATSPCVLLCQWPRRGTVGG